MDEVREESTVDLGEPVESVGAVAGTGGGLDGGQLDGGQLDTATEQRTDSDGPRVRGSNGRFQPRGDRQPKQQPKREKPQAEAISVTPQSVAPKRGPGRPPRSAPRKQTDAEVTQATNSWLNLLDMTARTLGGPDAALTSQERTLIEGPLKRTLGKYGAVTEKIASVADPVALVVGFGMWGSRVLECRANLVAATAAADKRVLVPGGGGPVEERGTPPIQQPLGELGTFVPLAAAETEMLDATD